MKNLTATIAAFAMLLTFGVGQAFSQASLVGNPGDEDSHTVTLNIEYFTYIQLLTGDLSEDVNALARVDDADGDGVITVIFPGIELLYGTNSDEDHRVRARVMSIDGTSYPSSGTGLEQHGTFEFNEIIPNEWNSPNGSAGSFAHGGSPRKIQSNHNWGNGQLKFIEGINQGGGKALFDYQFDVNFFDAPSETVYEIAYRIEAQ